MSNPVSDPAELVRHRKAAFQEAAAARLRRDQPALQVVKAVAREHSVPIALMLHPTRGPADAVLARQIAIYLVHVVLGRTITDVAAIFGRHRSTASYACGHIEDLRDRPEFDAQLTRLEAALEHAPARTGDVGRGRFDAAA